MLEEVVAEFVVAANKKFEAARDLTSPVVKSLIKISSVVVAVVVPRIKEPIVEVANEEVAEVSVPAARTIDEDAFPIVVVDVPVVLMFTGP